MKNLKQKVQDGLAYAKERMVEYDERKQNSNADVENGKVQALKQVLDFIKDEEIEKDKLEERKCKFCGDSAVKDALDEDGFMIEICENCDSKKENL